jgi:hypothetical protein
LSDRLGGAAWIQGSAGFLTVKSEEARLKALQRLSEAGKHNPSPDEIVAALTFDFWSNLFRPDYKSTWEDISFIRKCFPNMAAPYDWRFIQNYTRRINALRNRIAHHEPVWNQNNLILDYEKCLELINISCPHTKKWVQRHSTVYGILNSPPPKDSSLPGLSLSSITLDAPEMTSIDEPVIALAGRISGKRPAAAILDHNGDQYVVDSASILNGILEEADKLDGYVDVNSITIENISDHWKSNIVKANNSISTGDLASLFYPVGTNAKKRPTHAIISDGSNNIIGLIERPSIRYK